jgi:hypothetical protein
VIFSDRQFKPEISKENVYRFVLQTQNREINRLKKQVAFFQLKNYSNQPHATVNTVKSPEKEKEKQQGSTVKKNPTSVNKAAEEVPNFMSPKKRRFETEDLTPREQYLSDVSKSNIFDTPPRQQRSRERDIPTTPSHERTSYDIFSTSKTPGSSSRPPKYRTAEVIVEELCEHHHHTVPTTPPTTKHHPQKQQQSSVSKENMRPTPWSPQPSADLRRSKTSKENLHHPPRSSANDSNSSVKKPESIEFLMRRLKDLESEVHNIHISDNSIPVESRQAEIVRDTASSTSTTPPRHSTGTTRSPTKSSNDRAFDETATGHRFSFTSEEKSSVDRSAPQNKLFDKSPTRDSRRSPTIAESCTSSTAKTSPLRMPSQPAHVETNTDGDAEIRKKQQQQNPPAPQSVPGDEEFNSFCKHLSQASSPEEVQRILHSNFTKVQTPSECTPGPLTSNSKYTPHTNIKYSNEKCIHNKSQYDFSFTPVSVTAALSPLGSQGSGTSSKVAISDLTTYQSKLSSWRKRYPSSSGRGG